MLTGPDHLGVLYVPCDGTQDDLLHNLPRHRAWGSSHRRQSSMTFSNVGLSHRLQFFANCSSMGPFHGVQSFRNRLLQRGSPVGPQFLLQHRLSTWSQLPSGHISTCSGMGSSTGCRVDICSTVDLHGLQGDNLLHHGLHYGLQGNLCFGTWSTPSPSFFTDLVREEEEEEGSDQEASPSAKKQEDEVREIRQEAETTQSLTSNELQDMQKDYSCQPVWPVKKTDGRWRLTIDYRKLNANTAPPMAAIPNIATLTATLQAAAHPWMAVLVVKDMFFMVPLQEEDKRKFAFTWDGIQFTFNNLPQGYKHSPTVTHTVMAELLQTVSIPPEVKLYQYIDDILIEGDSPEPVGQATAAVWQALYNAEVKVSHNKCQGPSREVKFLGTWWVAGSAAIPPDTLNELEN
ncbi:hypothetical protein QYF61_024334 [Mycteria americana]|uniref:ribonuclease H n=1 Tax=Mycteria americana TaxID=33587 RepID=A0AAN7RHT8_MYCAM|nr:hypothetical protein QYF61_024334 [Mycteria americana]